jgi:hypothetical protein
MDAKQLLQNMFGKVEYYVTFINKEGPVVPPPKGDGQDWIMSDFRTLVANTNVSGISVMWIRNNDKL